MNDISGGSVIVDWKVNLSGLKAGLVEAQKLAGNAGGDSAIYFKNNFLENLNAKAIAEKLGKDIDAGFKAGKLADKKGSEFTSKFNSRVKGIFKGLNFGALSFGLNIATLAFGAITNAVRRAKEEKEKYRREVEDLTTALIGSGTYLNDAKRLSDLAGDSALSASQKVALLSGEYISLEKRLKKVGFRDKFEQLDALRAKADPLIKRREEFRKRAKDPEAKIAQQKKFTGNTDVVIPKNLRFLRSEIAKLDKQLAEVRSDAFEIIKTRSAKESKLDISLQAERSRILLAQQLNIARISGDKKAQAAAEDQILLESKRIELAKAGFDDVEGRAQRYVKAVRNAKNGSELRTDAEKRLSAATQDTIQVDIERNTELNKAIELFRSSRTPIEQYAAQLKDLANVEKQSSGDAALNTAVGGSETFERQRIAALVKLARSTEDAKLVFAEFDRLRKAGAITTAKEVDVLEKLNDVLGITADREKALANAEEERLKKEAELAFLEERKIDRQLLLARLANDNGEIDRLERQLDLERRIQELQEKGGKSKDDALEQASREINEEDVARTRGVFRSGFSDGLRAAMDGDLGSFLEQKLQDLASGMFDRAVENLADAVFDQLAQIAPGFLGQITGNANLPNALSGGGSAVAGTATNVATQAANGVAGQAASAGTQAAQATATATAVTTAMTTGGTAAATAIGTSMTTAGTAVAGQIAAAMASGGATSGLSNFAGFFATGGVIGSGKFGLVGENGPELVSAGSGPIRITPLDSGLRGFSTNGLESRGSSQSSQSNVVMNISGVKDLGSFVKSQGTIEADMAAAMRRAQSDF